VTPERSSGRRLAVVVAHPDDDTFGCAGSVALHADDPDFRFVLIHVTSGEAGRIADPALATPQTLGAVREEEDRRSWMTLGREPDRHEWLRYPDGGVADVPFGELVDRIGGIFAQERPDAVLTFGPDGVTGHLDHIAVGDAATEAFHRARAADGDGFARLFHTAIPQSIIDALNVQMVAAGREPFDPNRVYDPHGVPDDWIGMKVDCRSVAPRVLAALREHRTQADDFVDLSEASQLEAMAFEHAVVAWPTWRPGDPVVTDVFGGAP
jgi:LmbE family N-acetylglucosaminyl deacetylase